MFAADLNQIWPLASLHSKDGNELRAVFRISLKISLINLDLVAALANTDFSDSQYAEALQRCC